MGHYDNTIGGLHSPRYILIRHYVIWIATETNSIQHQPIQPVPAVIKVKIINQMDLEFIIEKSPLSEYKPTDQSQNGKWEKQHKN